MQGLIEEGQEHIREIDTDATRDAALIGAAQKVEHYEMAGWAAESSRGAAEAWCRTVGEWGGGTEALTGPRRHARHSISWIGFTFMDLVFRDDLLKSGRCAALETP